MTSQPPEYGSYPPPIRPENSGGTAFTNPASEAGAVPVQAPAPKKKRNVGLIVGLVLAVAGLALGGYYALTHIGTNDTTTPAVAKVTTATVTKLQAAAVSCSLATTPEDLGHTLTLRNVSAKEDPGPDDWKATECVMREIDVPSRVTDHIGQTRAMDGMQTDSWDGMSARWNYHPDSGINITFTDK